ncbi:MAG TPA: ATP-binding cassette domain-containing protein [Candidatus Eisenbacteria bacterium]|nr:ATP-binding cassette domain-containing protein [Candidatus Eisenbacteria bacterium]
MLELNNISKSYNIGTVNQRQIFDCFNLQIPNGQFLTIIGSNGSGKTSLLNLICGNIKPEAGTIKISQEERIHERIQTIEQDLTYLPEHKRYVRIGRVFQDPAAGTCPSMTLRENLALADNKNKSWNLRRAVNPKREKFYQEKLKMMDLGLENKLDEIVGNFSGGERQAIALLMATMMPIDYLILDEHTAALDPKAAENIMKLTARLVEDMNLTILMVTHNLNFALEYGERLIMLHQGEILLEKTGEDKKRLELNDLLDKFFKISIEVGNAI